MDNKDNIVYIPIEDILPNRFQPRLAFDEKELNELANSIIKYGVIQPIVLRKIGEKYEIIAGERRYKASCLAGLQKIPAIIKDTDDNTSAEIALLENIQRKNLTVIEEAQSYKKLIDKGFTQDDIASKMGVSQSSIANKMRLLNLPKEVQDALLFNRISERHARSLLSLNNPDLQKSLLNRIINEKLTVKQTEDEISTLLNKNNNEIPDDIQKFLNMQSIPVVGESNDNVIKDIKNEVEILDFNVPEVVTIENNDKPQISIYEEEEKIINPFQNANYQANIIDQIRKNPFEEETKNIIEKVEEEPLIPDSIENEEVTIEAEKEYIKDSLLNEYGEVDLPKVINKVRDFINGLDEVSHLITTSELDLLDKYQITIEIKKE